MRLRLHEIGREHPPATLNGLEPEARILGQLSDSGLPLVMWVAENLSDRQHAPGLERLATLGQGRNTVGNLSQSRTQKHQVEHGFRNMRLGSVAEDRRQVRHTRLFCVGLV